MADRKYNIGDRVVVIAPPGSGKSALCKKYPDIFTELQSEYYEFEANRPFDEVPGFYDPWWPANYINAIELMLETGKMFNATQKILFVSSHVEVAKYLSDRGIKFCFMCPIKETVIDNCKKANYNSWFIKYIEENWNGIKDRISNMSSCKSVLMYSCSLEDAFFHNDFNSTYHDIIKNFMGE